MTGITEFLRNELATAVVTGTMSKPQVSLSPLAGTTRVLGRLFGGTPTEQQRMLDQIEKRAARMNTRGPVRGTHAAVEPN